MNASADHCVVIEDSLAGVQGARAAGMRVIGFTGGGHCGPTHAEMLKDAGATATVAHMRDLPAVVERLVA
jgi:beta-phosphoglucomutase-like phosphatase (HAD superfamily)